MNIIIRSEQVKDYNQIAIVNYEAFHNWKSDNPFVIEPLMVDVLRHNSLFDSELSLVVEFNNEIIGHVIFSPFTYTFSGEEVKGAILGPIAIKPKYQKQGIGGKLISAGHKILKEKGYDLSLLCGHTDYYPKFGYKTSMYAFSGSKITVNERNYDIKNIEEKPVSTEDMTWINDKWLDVHKDDLIAISPGKTIIDYANHGTPCYCSMILKDNKVIAYVRYQISSEMTIKELLADKEETVEVLKYLSNKHQGVLNINLSYNYLNEILGSNKMFTLEDNAASNDAFMILPLKESGCVSEYCNNVESNKIKAGVISLPPIYDIEE